MPLAKQRRGSVWKHGTANSTTPNSRREQHFHQPSLSSLALPWAPNTLPVCIFHIPLAYKRDINTFLAWHSGEIVCPRDEIILPTLSKWITVHRYQEIQATHRKKHSQVIKMKCGSWNWNWEYLVWMAGFNLNLLKAPINLGDMHQCWVLGMSMGLQKSVTCPGCMLRDKRTPKCLLGFRTCGLLNSTNWQKNVLLH